MKSEPSNRLFEVLEPPRGGLATLRTRLERDRRRRVRHAMWAPAATAAALALVLTVTLWPSFQRTVPEPLPAFELARMRLGTVTAPSETVTIPAGDRSRTAAHRISETDRVAFYIVASR